MRAQNDLVLQTNAHASAFDQRTGCVELTTALDLHTIGPQLTFGLSSDLPVLSYAAEEPSTSDETGTDK